MRGLTNASGGRRIGSGGEQGNSPAVSETRVLSLIWFLLVVWVVLCLGLAAWTIWFQNYVYLEATAGVFWRAAVAGSVLTAYLGFWCLLSYLAVRADPKSPNPFATTFNFNPSRDQQYPVLWTVVRKRHTPEEGKAPEETEVRTRYQLVWPGKGPPQYRKDGLVHGAELPPRPEEIIVREGDEEVSFKPDRDANGNYKIEEDKGFFTPPTKRPLKYRDARNRVMEEGSLGVLPVPPRTGQIVVNCLLNFGLLGVWFACVWLLLRFQAGHAFLMALACWLVMLFCIVGPAFDRAERAAKSQPVVRPLETSS
jgi:hypothetical protein